MLCEAQRFLRQSPARGAKINWTKTMAALRALAWSPLSRSLPPFRRHSVDRWQISVCVPPFLFETGARWVRSLSHFPTPCHLFFSPHVSLKHLLSVSSFDSHSQHDIITVKTILLELPSERNVSRDLSSERTKGWLLT